MTRSITVRSMSDEFSANISNSTSSSSGFGWKSMESDENINTSYNQENQSDDDTTDSSDNENGIKSENPDLESFKERVIRKERNAHQMSDEKSDSPSKLGIRKENHSKLEEGQANDTVPKICINGTLDTREGIPFNLDSDDEIWIVQCPTNVEASDLKGNMMDISGISTFGSNYIGTSLRQKTGPKSNIILLMPNKPFALKTAPVAGHIIITQKVDVPPLELPAVKSKIATPLPEGLKLRHPLLGFVISNGESFDCDATYIKHNRKKNKHKHVDSSQTTTYSDSENSPLPNKKRKKKEKELSQSESIDMTPNICKKEKYSVDLDISPSSNKKKKKKKKELPESIEVTHNMCKKEKDSAGSEISPSPHKKKKKKTDLSQSESIEMTPNVSEKEKDSVDSEISPSPHKKTKKKNKELSQSESIEMTPNICKKEKVGADSETSPSPKKKKKKKKTKELSESIEVTHNICKTEKDNVDSEISSSPNKKKKKKTKELSESIEVAHNMCKKEKDSADSKISPSPSKKKKKKRKELTDSIEVAQNICKKEKDSETEDVIESSQATKTNKLSLYENHSSEILFPLSQYFDESMETYNSSFERKKNKKKKKDKCDTTEVSVQDKGLVTQIHFKKEDRKSDSEDNISLLNTSRTKKSAKKYVSGEELISPKSHTLSSERLTMKRRRSENEVNGVSPKKKKFKLSASQDYE